MSGIYYTQMADVLRVAGLEVVECDGWQTRARSSGGFASPPLGIQWHHTASQSTPEGDTNYQINSDDAPIGNGTIMRDGSVWLIAAGAANTAGKGGPVTMSRGVVSVDTGNSKTWAWEVANSGTGEPWPVEQIDAYFAASNAANELFGNLPTDVFTHAIGEGDGWTDRKIDPATAAAVQGPWRPRSLNSSGTWSLADIRAECSRRAGSSPEPTPPEPEPEPQPPQPTTDSEDRMLGLVRLESNPNAIYVTDGIAARKVRSDEIDELTSNLQYDTGFRYYDLTSAARPQIRDVNKIPKRSDDQIQLWGIETEESETQV